MKLKQIFTVVKKKNTIFVETKTYWIMKKNLFLFFITVLLLVSCGRGKGASKRAMEIVGERFSICHLRDSLGESNITHLWSEYDSRHSSILCFHYGGCAIEYFYHEFGENERRDSFVVKNGKPFIEDIKDVYGKINNSESLRLDERQQSFMEGFRVYFKDEFPKEDDFIEEMISGLAQNFFKE